LIRQLKPGGRLVIPLGAPLALQRLVLLERNPDDGQVTTKQLLPVNFVPLTSGSRQRILLSETAGPNYLRAGTGGCQPASLIMVA
jgi:Protein-L-isoaspartate(D-aspartate) O-methyltransferase (PCMT)